MMYISHPNPAVDYADAVRRVDCKLAAEVDFDPENHTFLLTHGSRTAKAIVLVHGYTSSPAPLKALAAQFHQRGSNVLVMALPYHGLADRMNIEHAKLRAEDLMRYADDVVDVAQGLGESVTMAGLSCGGLVTGWAAQHRPDLGLAVVISPGFAFKAIPGFLRPLAGWVWRVFPNSYIWDDPQKKADNPRRCNYPRLSTRALGQILRLSQSIQTTARLKAPAARSILVVTNLNDPAVDNTATDRVVDLWRKRRPNDVQTYQFPANLGLGHDIVSVDDPKMIVDAVYPELLRMIG